MDTEFMIWIRLCQQEQNDLIFSFMNQETDIPEDILRRWANHFSGQDYDQALAYIELIKNDHIPVGWIQLSRAVIIVAEKDISKMKSIIESLYWGDPRDVLVGSSTYPGQDGNYGRYPFSDL